MHRRNGIAKRFLGLDVSNRAGVNRAQALQRHASEVQLAIRGSKAGVAVRLIRAARRHVWALAIVLHVSIELAIQVTQCFIGLTPRLPRRQERTRLGKRRAHVLSTLDNVSHPSTERIAAALGIRRRWLERHFVRQSESAVRVGVVVEGSSITEYRARRTGKQG